MGKPLKYKTVKELENAVNDYFDWCDNRIVHYYSPKHDKVIDAIEPAPYTMSGLARHLGMDRRTLLDYSKRDRYLPTIKAAREKVHEDVESRLMEKNATGAIFNLKNNFDWKDKTEVEQSGELKINNNKKYSDEELDEVIARTLKENESGGKGKITQTASRKTSEKSK